jgi:hypothetical protein
MTDRNPDRPDRPVPADAERRENIVKPAVRIDDRGGFRDTAPNPHDEEGAAKTAAQTTGAMAGMMLPAVIVAIVAIVIILYFVLR